MRPNPSDDFDSLNLGDARLSARARRTAKAFSEQPSLGGPRVLSAAELEGYYRFVNNERVTFGALLSAHATATVERAAKFERLVVAHDTTEYRFSDEVERPGLAPMGKGAQGFYSHVSLVLATRQHALGVVAVENLTREPRATKQTQAERYEDPAKESLRWMRGVLEAERVFAEKKHVRLVHVMDRETDDYDILGSLTEAKLSFVVRGSYDRRLPEPGASLKSFARQMDVCCTRSANLVRRAERSTQKQRKLHPARDARVAELTFAAAAVVLPRPPMSKANLATLSLNIVRAFEANPPEGCEPIEWFLLTSEPVDTEEQILQVVDDYRARWTIEEFFKALKSGCAFEKRQHETKSALLNALGIFIPIAWSLLNLRTASRDESYASRPAEEAFSPTQLQIIRLKANNKLPEKPTIREAVIMLARLFGGFQPSNGQPGWSILGAAFEKLLTLEAGWRMAMSELSAETGRSDR